MIKSKKHRYNHNASILTYTTDATIKKHVRHTYALPRILKDEPFQHVKML